MVQVIRSSVILQYRFTGQVPEFRDMATALSVSDETIANPSPSKAK